MIQRGPLPLLARTRPGTINPAAVASPAITAPTITAQAAAAACMGLTLAALLGGCSRPPAAEVIAGDGVLCDLTRHLAGEALKVECLMGPNDDPHRFQLSPAQSRALRQARLVLINGYGLTPALERIPGAVPVAELAVPDSPQLAGGDHGEHGQHPEHPGPGADHDDHAADHASDHPGPHAPSPGAAEEAHQHSGRDPHVWHDPRQAAAMVRLVSQRLQTLAPAAAGRDPAIRRREQRMLQDLAALHSWNQRQFATLPATPGRRTLATGHRAFASLSRAYGLAELPLVDGFSSSETLRPQALSRVVLRLRRDRIPALFSEQWPAGRTMTRISALSGVPLAQGALRADGLNAVPGDTGARNGDLMATLMDNTCLIVENLGGRCDRATQLLLMERWHRQD